MQNKNKNKMKTTATKMEKNEFCKFAVIVSLELIDDGNKNIRTKRGGSDTAIAPFLVRRLFTSYDEHIAL